MKKSDRLVVLGTLSISLALLLLHFAATIVYVFPLNPIKAGVFAPLMEYMGDVFAQNWSLFAPTPIHTNFGVLVQCLGTDGKATGWFNLSDAMIDGLHRNPVGPYVRLVRMPFSALREYGGAYVDDQTKSIIKANCKPGIGPDACLAKNPAYARSIELGKSDFQGLASAVCANALPGKLAAVRAEATMEDLRPWSKRDAADWRPKVTAMGMTPWLPPRHVASMPFQFEGTH